VRILLVRLRLIGDVVFTTPVIRALRRHHPDAHLAYVVEPAAAPVLHGNPHLDELIVVPSAGASYVCSMMSHWRGDSGVSASTSPSISTVVRAPPG